MRVPPWSFLHLLLALHVSLGAQARPYPFDVLAGAANVSRPFPPILLDHRNLPRRMIVHGLPQPWHGVFRSIRSIQPPLPIPTFTNFFLQVARIAHSDPVPGRSYQKFTYGALILEFISATPNNMSEIVTKEFVEAAALWLFDAAKNGWTDLFEAWILDPTDKQVIYVHVANYWDAWTKRP